jgi:hypothetical protein
MRVLKKGFNYRLVLTRTHAGDRPYGTLLSEVHPDNPPPIAEFRYVTLTEPGNKGVWKIRYRRVYFECGCVGQRPDGPKRFIPSKD